MKKITVVLAAVACILLASCGAKKDANGWYDDFEAAKKEAKSSNKNILLFVNSDMDVPGTDAGVKFLLENADFTKAVKDKVVCVHFDFTDLAAAMAEIPEGATNKEQKAAEKRKAKLNTQFRIADCYMVQQTPAVVLATKEGYFITDVQFDFIGTTADGYVSALSLEDAVVSEVNAMVSATKKGSSAERVKAIDKFYESQSEGHRLLLSDLCRKVLSLDKKNETGLVSKYIVALSHADAYTYLVTGDVEKVLSIYEKNAADKRISPDDAQTLYYIAANVLANTRVGSADKIIELLEKSIAASPESEYAPTLMQILDSVKQMKASEEGAVPDYSAESSAAEEPAEDTDAGSGE